MSFLPGILSKNWQLKLSALAMAVLLWTVPRFEGQSTQILEDIPVTVDLSDLDWAQVEDPSPPVVSVTVSGPARELIALGIDPPPLVIPMSNLTAGDTTVLLRPSWFRGYGRDGVVVEGLRPDAVQLKFERIQQKVVPLAARLVGRLPEGLGRSGPVVVTPGETSVFGPASRLEGLDSLRLVPFDLSRFRAGDSLVQPVDTAGLGVLTIVHPEASMTIPTEPTIAREFPDVTVGVPLLDEDPQLRVRPATVRVVLVGARSLVEAVDPADITVSISGSQATLGPGEEAEVAPAVSGVPEFVQYNVFPEWVTLQRPAGQ